MNKIKWLQHQRSAELDRNPVPNIGTEPKDPVHINQTQTSQEPDSTDSVHDETGRNQQETTGSVPVRTQPHSLLLHPGPTPGQSEPEPIQLDPEPSTQAVWFCLIQKGSSLASVGFQNQRPPCFIELFP